MKTVFSIITLLLFTQATVSDTTLTKEEREFAVAYLTETQDYFQHAIEGLSTEQLNFKATPESWSIAQCIEHIAITESMGMDMIAQLMQAPADGSKRGEIKITNEILMKALEDRSMKVKAPEIIQPTGKLASAEEAAKSFNIKRDEVKDWVTKTQDDLHNHLMPHPAFGMLDSYQWVLLLGGHCKRHSLQIEEVKANPNFPKK